MGELDGHIRDEVLAGESILVMSLRDVHDMLTRVSTNAIARYEAMCDQAKDMMKQGEAKRYMLRMGYKACMLKTLLDAGMIHVDKPSDKPNGAVWYSKSEIENAITAINMSKVMVKDALYKKKLKINQ